MRYVILRIASRSDQKRTLTGFAVEERARISHYHLRAAKQGQIVIVDVKRNRELSGKHAKWTETARSNLLSQIINTTGSLGT